MRHAALAIDQLGDTLLQAQYEQAHSLPCSLIGGIAPFIQPFLAAKLRERIHPCQMQPDAGAILLVRHALAAITT